MATSAPDFSGFTYSGSAPSAQPASDATGDQGVLSGLGDLFSAVGAGVSSGIKASQTPSVVGPAGAGVVYNPATGRYTSIYGVNAQASMTPLLLIFGLGLVLYLAFRKA